MTTETTPRTEIDGWNGTPGPYEIVTTTLSWRLVAPSDKSGQVCYGDLPAHTWNMTPEQKASDRSMCDARLFAASYALALFVQKVAATDHAELAFYAEQYVAEARSLLSSITQASHD